MEFDSISMDTITKITFSIAMMAGTIEHGETSTSREHLIAGSTLNLFTTTYPFATIAFLKLQFPTRL
jgi:hypothetical protein